MFKEVEILKDTFNREKLVGVKLQKPFNETLWRTIIETK